MVKCDVITITIFGLGWGKLLPNCLAVVSLGGRWHGQREGNLHQYFTINALESAKATKIYKKIGKKDMEQRC